jgi:N-acyl-D-aspartate/D-glutamate deacylase
VPSIDVAIRGGEVVDGTGAPGRRADVGIAGGRVVAVGDVGDATTTIDANGRVVVPGFVDVHTHVDAQALWDPMLTPSSLHGVTTVIGGNCGFTLSPLGGSGDAVGPDDAAADYLVRMLAVVEGMPLEALRAGVPLDWRSTGEYLDRLDGTLALNAGFSVGHSALRRVVMGTAATERPSTAAELDAMRGLLRGGIAAGALGFSSSWGAAHMDADGEPVPSRAAELAELLALAAVCGEFDGTSLEFIPRRVDVFGPTERDALVGMSLAARRPLNWNIMRVTADTVAENQALVDATAGARDGGGRVVALHMPIPSRARFSFRTGFVLEALPGFREVLALPHADERRALADPAVRARLRASEPETVNLREIAEWGNRIITEVFEPSLAPVVGRRVDELAAEAGVAPLDALLDVVVADDLRTTFTRPPSTPSADDWAASLPLLRDGGVVIGGSDTGAHLDFTAYFDYPVYVLEHAVRHHGAFSLEEAVRLLTDVPARLYGLRDRGRLVPGAWADVVVLDPDTVASGELETRFDLPAGAGRLYAEPVGIDHVLVNGTTIVTDGRPTGARPGTLLRSGRDTTSTPAA